MLASVLALAGAAALANAQFHPVLNPGLDRGRMENDLRNNLHPTHSNWDYWGDDWIPESCRTIALQKGLNPWDFSVFNVHYDDVSLRQSHTSTFAASVGPLTLSL